MAEAEPEPIVVEIGSEHPELSIAASIVPWPRDDERTKYFGCLCSGFSVREALVWIERSKSWLSERRHDPKFVELEGRIPEFRNELAREYLGLEFFRNFRFVLEKDYRVLRRSLGLERDEDGKIVGMTTQDQGYLTRMRTQYNPQQLQILESIVSGGGGGWSFTKWVSENQEFIQASRTDTITVVKK